MDNNCMDRFLTYFDNTKLESHKEEIKQYCIKSYKKELELADKLKDTSKSMEYVRELEYEKASFFINMTSWNSYYGELYAGVYQGRRLTCNDCKNGIKNGCELNINCSKLDNNIKVNIFNDICKNFDNRIKVKYDEVLYNSLENYLQETGKLNSCTMEEWKSQKIEYCSFNDYIHFLNNDYYIDAKLKSKLQYKYNTLMIDDKTLHIPINTRWFKLDFIKDNNIYCNRISIPTKKRHTPCEVIGKYINYSIPVKS